MTQSKDNIQLSLSHLGIYVQDLEKMSAFYKETFEFTQTDKGDLGHTQLVFLSRDPAEHHQLVLATGRPDNLQFNLINQISFRVPNLDNLRRFYARAKNHKDVSDIQCVTHGNAVSVYCRDPEGNRLEIFMDTPWYCDQPLREPIDLELSDEQIMAKAEAIARKYPKFKLRSEWHEEMRQLMGV
ncbi:VOC family protein [Advenella alkanexedens]|jgi:catechol-2,3-dioxygenase|uniref:VOC family protein n=1 Tax=Advenella alkanexedens TaxID=1481665 RepID=A0ABS6NNG0_9BURK|nr:MULTISPECIES: VOC family protein [Advenella]MBV4397168.1 VOC family protein [Advenella alkanexedens]MDD3758495.1 VOC family protein [Advenella sp.]NLN68205.1 VOC family protein [Alcaligenaceae bacterium]WKU18242.1 VOC family protein [Advenella alkanexedens]